jgi:hypothetical protein
VERNRKGRKSSASVLVRIECLKFLVDGEFLHVPFRALHGFALHLSLDITSSTDQNEVSIAIHAQQVRHRGSLEYADDIPYLRFWRDPANAIILRNAEFCVPAHFSGDVSYTVSNTSDCKCQLCKRHILADSSIGAMVQRRIATQVLAVIMFRPFLTYAR